MVEVKSRYLQAAVIVHLLRTVTKNGFSGRINTEIPADLIRTQRIPYRVLLFQFKGKM